MIEKVSNIMASSIYSTLKPPFSIPWECLGRPWSRGIRCHLNRKATPPDSYAPTETGTGKLQCKTVTTEKTWHIVSFCNVSRALKCFEATTPPQKSTKHLCQNFRSPHRRGPCPALVLVLHWADATVQRAISCRRKTPGERKPMAYGCSEASLFMLYRCPWQASAAG